MPIRRRGSAASRKTGLRVLEQKGQIPAFWTQKNPGHLTLCLDPAPPAFGKSGDPLPVAC